MITINPIRNTVPYAKLNRVQNNSSQQTTFKANTAKISEESVSILRKAYEILREGENKLAKTKVVKNNFEIAYAQPRASKAKMTKYDHENNTLVRLNQSIFDDTLGIHLDNFDLREKMYFDVYIGDSWEIESIHKEEKGKISNFEWSIKGKRQKFDSEQVNKLIKKYFG